MLYKYYVESIANGKKQLALSAFSTLEKFYPNLDVIEDIKKYELFSSDVSSSDLVNIYNSEFEKLKQVTIPPQANKMVMNMVSGEMFIRSQGIEIQSFLLRTLIYTPGKI